MGVSLPGFPLNQTVPGTESPSQVSGMQERWLLAVRILGVGLYFGHLPVVGLELLETIDHGSALFVCLLGSIAGCVLADLISGLVHWASDSFGRSTTPILGPLFVRPFREHHIDASAITRESFLELHGTNCFFAAPLLVLGTYVVQPLSGGFFALFVGSLLFALAVGVLGAGQIHRWVHQEQVPRTVKFLQRAGLIISASAHRTHHEGDHSSHYCIVGGWWNEPLRRWGVFESLEAALENRAGIRTTRDCE